MLEGGTHMAETPVKPSFVPRAYVDSRYVTTSLPLDSAKRLAERASAEEKTLAGYMREVLLRDLAEPTGVQPTTVGSPSEE
jgi:hypothetical protein